jgi:hypothetical protein
VRRCHPPGCRQWVWHRMEDTMRRSNEMPAGRQRPTLDFGSCNEAAPLAEPRLLNDGSIDYEFYKARTRRLRHEFVAEVRFSLARQAIRGLTLLAERIVALGDNRTLEIRPGR